MREYIIALQNYKDFNSITERKGYWLFILIGHLIYPLIIFYSIQQFSFFYMEIISNLGLPLYYSLIVTPTLAIQARRLNDIGYSRKYLFLLIIPPIGIVTLLVLSILNSKKRETTRVNLPQESTYLVNSNLSSQPPILYRLLTGLMIGILCAAICEPIIQSLIMSIEPPDSFEGSNTNPITGLGIALAYGGAIYITIFLSFVAGSTLGFKLFNQFLVNKYLV